MKILVGVDGPHVAASALSGLKNVGIPADAEIEILSVDNTARGSDCGSTGLDWADSLRKELSEEFGYRVRSEVSVGDPTHEILARAAALGADLIVICEGRAFPKNQKLGLKTRSDKVLREAECSVRICRGEPDRDPSPVRIVIGYDGSPGSNMAVKAVCERQWPLRSKVQLLVVTDSAVLESIGRFSPQMTDTGIESKIAGQWASTVAAIPLQRLRSQGLDADFCFESGDPKNTIVDFAETWNADCIFVGFQCRSRPLEMSRIGSVSFAVATRAHCSVELVRNVQ